MSGNGNGHRSGFKLKGKDGRALEEREYKREMEAFLRLYRVPCPDHLNAALEWNYQRLKLSLETDTWNVARKLAELIELTQGKVFFYKVGPVQLFMQVVYLSAFCESDNLDLSTRWDNVLWTTFREPATRRQSEPLRFSLKGFDLTRLHEDNGSLILS